MSDAKVDAEGAPLAPGEGWSDARPEAIPRPSFWPAGMAFGVSFLLWGFLTSPVVMGVGLAVAVASLAGWIGEMRHE